ncbi:MAG: F0F1 ATP synthase subunit delta [Desulfovibrionaceae bacterium]|nr:F0F1 ATP synthase subunit delta [Desulfovibrionaceae bacterium]
MIGNVVARRYASALFALGRESGMADMERYGAALNALGEAVEQSRPLADLFRNPVLTVDEKKKVALSLLEAAGGGPVERRFVELLADKGRLSLLSAIAADYSALLDEAKDLRRGVLTTAVELDDARRAAIKTQLESQTGRKLELAYTVDPAILGGLVLKIGDTVLDASLRAQLDNLRESIKRGA